MTKIRKIILFKVLFMGVFIVSCSTKTAPFLYLNSNEIDIYVRSTESKFIVKFNEEFHSNKSYFHDIYTNKYLCEFNGDFTKKKLPKNIKLTYAKYDKWFDDSTFGTKQFNSTTGDSIYITRAGETVSREKWIETGFNLRNLEVDKIHDQLTWYSYEFDVKDYIKKFNGKDPEGYAGEFNVNFPFPSFNSKNINIYLTINDDGTVTVTDFYRWKWGRADSQIH